MIEQYFIPFDDPTPEDPPTKLCPSCQLLKPTTEYYLQKRTDKPREICKKCACARTMAWRAANPERHKTACQRHEKARYSANPEAARIRYKAWRERHPLERKPPRPCLQTENPEEYSRRRRALARQRRAVPAVKAKERAYAQRVRLEILTHYSGGTPRCACCSECLLEFLAIDHIYGGGREHRRQVKHFYSWLRRNNYPEGFRVLCHNCNFALGKYGYCPHGNLPPIEKHEP